MATIAEERKLLKAQGLTFRSRIRWGAVEDYSSPRACDEVADGFFLHIAVVDDPSDLRGEEDEVARTIERIGQSRFGSGMSYNALVFNTGKLYEGQPLGRRGTHTVNTYFRDTCPTHGGLVTGPRTSSGYNLNVNFRALCLPQQVDDPVTESQLDTAARWAAAQVRAGLARRGARWHGHRCVTAKGCPGQIAFDRIDDLQRLTDYYIENGLENDVNDEQIDKIADRVVEKLLAKKLEVKRGDKKVKLAISQMWREIFNRS